MVTPLLKQIPCVFIYTKTLGLVGCIYAKVKEFGIYRLSGLIRREFDGKNAIPGRKAVRFFRDRLTCGNPSWTYLPVCRYEFATSAVKIY
jgi:hypothetical protein